MGKVPRDIQISVKEVVYKKADEHGYLKKGRPENSIFMENLVKDPEVGDILSQYMTKAEIKTYVKDAILNRYSKDKISEELSKDVKKIIHDIFKQRSIPIEDCKTKRISLHRLDNGEVVVIAEGTLLKWETALRKALEFTEKSPGLKIKGKKPHILLRLALMGKTINEADRKHLISSLELINVKVSL